jgi:phospholipase A-2-activating protein
MQKKIEELNQTLIKEGHKDLSLNPTELSVLRSIITHLSSSGATKTSQTISGGLDLALKLTLTWPYSSRLPGLDLLRLLAVAPQTATYKHPRGGSIIDLLIASVTETENPAENNIMMAIRAFANLFESAEGRTLALQEFNKVQHLASDALADGKTSNRNLLVAITTLYINYAVLFTSSDTATSSEDFEHPVAILDSLRVILSTQSDSEVVYRALVAVGTLLSLGGEVKNAAVEVYNLQDVVKSTVTKAKDPRVNNVGKEIAGSWR